MDPIVVIVVGVTLITILGIEFGGVFLLRQRSRATPFTPLQQSFFRAGHAHAGVLVMLGLVVIGLLGSVGVAPQLQWAGVGVLSSAILLPAGFFLSVLGKNSEQPGKPLSLVWIGATVLSVSLVVAAVAIIAAGITALG